MGWATTGRVRRPQCTVFTCNWCKAHWWTEQWLQSWNKLGHKPHADDGTLYNATLHHRGFSLSQELLLIAAPATIHHHNCCMFGKCFTTGSSNLAHVQRVFVQCPRWPQTTSERLRSYHSPWFGATMPYMLLTFVEYNHRVTTATIIIHMTAGYASEFKCKV